MPPSVPSSFVDPAQLGRQALDAIFNPRAVAVIGATEKAGSVGRTVLWNLISSPFGGTVYPINPQRPSILGMRAYKNLREIPEPVDLAVIVTPATSVPAIIGECADLGIKGAIVISAGFKETGPEGVELERQVMEQARRGNMRIIGPNCLGVMNCLTGLNATFADGIARPGNVGFISQSGALCTAVLDWSRTENVGFSAFVSIGSMLDVGWGDLIDYLGRDERTQSIVIYMETIGNARSFLSAAREVALEKPIIVIKPGRTEGAAKAAASHTGSLTGSDEVLESAFRRSGVLRVNSIAEVFYMAEVLAKQPRPKGPRLTIITNAGGPGVIATDALLMNDGELAEISPATYDKLNTFLPAAWSHNNPIDVLGDAGADRYAKTLEVAGQDDNSDGLLVILTPQAMTKSTETAQLLTPYAHSTGKPVLASWMGGAGVEEGIRILNAANIPTFPYPDTAVRVFTYMWRYSQVLKSIYETPTLASDLPPDRDAVTRLLAEARASGRTLLTELESKAVLAAYHIPTVQTLNARSADEAVDFAENIGYPVVVKLLSEVITHKTDVGGVILNLTTADEVRAAYERIHANVLAKAGPTAPDGRPNFLGVTVQPMIKQDGYELIVGSSIDPQFGPVLLFGTGGQLVEVFKDRALALPPLTTTLARRMMERTKIFHALQGVRGRAAIDLNLLGNILVRFGQLVVENPWIKELDINPLLASPERIIAVDARVVLHDLDTPESALPRPAIRPYPSQYVIPWKMADGTPITIRPLRPEDEPLLIAFHETLSDRTVYQRFLQTLSFQQRVEHTRLSRICFIDYEREMALAAVDETSGRIMGVSRLIKIPGSQAGEFNVIVSDTYQGRGVGTELVRRLIPIARDEKLNYLVSVPFLSDNQMMMRLAQRLNMRHIPCPDGMHRVDLHL